MENAVAALGRHFQRRLITQITHDLFNVEVIQRGEVTFLSDEDTHLFPSAQEKAKEIRPQVASSTSDQDHCSGGSVPMKDCAKAGSKPGDLRVSGSRKVCASIYPRVTFRRLLACESHVPWQSGSIVVAVYFRSPREMLLPFPDAEFVKKVNGRI